MVTVGTRWDPPDRRPGSSIHGLDAPGWAGCRVRVTTRRSCSASRREPAGDGSVVTLAARTGVRRGSRPDRSETPRKTPPAAEAAAAADLTAAAADGACAVSIADPLPLDRFATAPDRVDAGGHQRVLLAIP